MRKQQFPPQYHHIGCHGINYDMGSGGDNTLTLDKGSLKVVIGPAVAGGGTLVVSGDMTGLLPVYMHIWNEKKILFWCKHDRVCDGVVQVGVKMSFTVNVVVTYAATTGIKADVPPGNVVMTWREPPNIMGT